MAAASINYYDTQSTCVRVCASMCVLVYLCAHRCPCQVITQTFSPPENAFTMQDTSNCSLATVLDGR